MNKIFLVALTLAAFPTAHAQFTPGNLVVLRDGSGLSALTSAGTAIYLDQYTTAGSIVSSQAIPASGPTALVNSGSAGSEGALNLSANGQYLVFSGYNTNAGVTSIASSTAAAAPRGVATVDAIGNYTLAATTSSAFSANNVRSGTADGNGNYWAAGANSGAFYLGTGTPGAVSTTSANNRVIQDIGGNLYFSTGAGSTRGIYKISGSPTSGANPAVSLINNGAAASPYDFAFDPSMTVAYIADSDAYVNSTTIGGVEKWTLAGNAWTFNYSLSLGTNGAVGLAVDFSGVNAIIYATSASGNSLFSIIDTGTGASGTLLATAGSNQAFRGLDFAPSPVPEPATLALGGLGMVMLWRFRQRHKTVD